MTKLTVWHVIEGRQAVAAGETLRSVASRLGVPYDTLRGAVRGATWVWLDDPPPVAPHYIRRAFSAEFVAALWCRYEAGDSIYTISDDYDWSAETLRRAFLDAGYKLRGRNASTVRLNSAIVLRLRKLHSEGHSVAHLARLCGAPYQTVWQAVRGVNWADVGGKGGKSQSCKGCGLLTVNVGGYCIYCLTDS